MKTKGTITISNPRGTNDYDKVSIRLGIRSPRIRFCDVEIEHEVFSRALLGLGDGPCTITLRGIDKLKEIGE